MENFPEWGYGLTKEIPQIQPPNFLNFKIKNINKKMAFKIT